MAPTKKKTGRTTPAKSASPEAAIDAPVELAIDPNRQLSPKQFDMVRAASRWKMSDLIEDGEPTGKYIAANLWLAVRAIRPDITPEQVYDSEDLSEFGIQLVPGTPDGDDKLDPTTAAG